MADEPKGMKGETLGQFIGLERSRMDELARRGILVKVGPNLYDAAKSIRQYCEDLREKAAGRKGSGTVDPTEENALLKRAQRIQVEEKTKLLIGETVVASDIERGMEELVLSTRAGFLGLPAEAATELGLDRSQADKLDQMIRDRLESLADKGVEVEKNSIDEAMKEEPDAD